MGLRSLLELLISSPDRQIGNSMAGVSEESAGPRIGDRQLGEGSEKRKKPRPPWQEWEVSQTSLKIGVVSQHRPTARVSGSQGGGRGEGREQNVWSPMPTLM